MSLRADGKIGGVPIPFDIALVVTALIWAALRDTAARRRFYAHGGNDAGIAPMQPVGATTSAVTLRVRHRR